MFEILQKILRSHPFLMSQNCKLQGCQRYVVKRFKFILADERSNETRLGTLHAKFHKESDIRE